MIAWRTIERGKRWREKSGRFVIERRVGGDYGPVPRYVLLSPAFEATSLSAHEGGMKQFRGFYDSVAEAKRAAEATE